MSDDTAVGTVETLYLCNFRVSVDGDWLCLKELQDAEMGRPPSGNNRPVSPGYDGRDPVAIERSNLINISKLVVKELMETSVPFGRMLDSDHVPLQHFFIVLEHALRHGLRPKRGLLGPKKELWDVLQTVERLTSEAADITTSVRDLPTVRTPLGRARAWLRLALMQKKLPDYVRLLLENQQVLEEHYEPGALMLSEEAIHVLGLLVGLNVIDCNLCMKEEELDCQQGVIDFSLYLRASPTEEGEPGAVGAQDMTDSKYERVLDQKNYIEELNRHLNATVTNLQSKLEQQMATCALLREDLAIARQQAAGRQPSPAPGRTPDTLSVASRSSQQSSSGGGGGGGGGSPSGCAEELEDLRAQLREERAHRREIEKEMEMQIQMKAEMEMATKLLEKDVHEKQDTIVTLRRQLDDIKAINLEMYNKLQECQQALKQSNDVVTGLEEKILTLTATSRKMDEVHTEAEQRRRAAEASLTNFSVRSSCSRFRQTSRSHDLMIEREWRESLQAGMVEDREKMAALQRSNEQLTKKLEDQEGTDVEMERLRVRCEEHERTLEELGHHLSESKLRMEDLRQTARYALDGQWVPDSAAQHCKGCKNEFTISRRKHHCRNCGGVFCNPCSDNTMALAASAKPVRVCDACHTFLLQRYQAD
ncbi:protein RUFY3-like [Amphibalanus amphitrite]|uniref:protein RUFY3-like n=1 Tax=Amphibalanus amphitrite TaxID=1232801 RepID=UPI001C90F6F2|nr:protein RUFY3-like [Amphibalanus amphitrite]